MDDRLLSLPEAARVAGVSEDELRCAVKDGLLAARFLQNTGEYHIRHADLNAYVQRSRRGSTTVPTARRRRVLIIEDEINYANLLKLELERDPRIEAKFTTWGRDGVTLAERFAPDLFLIDLFLPGIRGDEVLKALQEHRTLQRAKKLVYSAHTKEAVTQDPRLQARLRDLGAEDFLSKTDGMRQMLVRIYELLGLDTRTKILRKLE